MLIFRKKYIKYAPICKKTLKVRKSTLTNYVIYFTSPSKLVVFYPFFVCGVGTEYYRHVYQGQLRQSR